MQLSKVRNKKRAKDACPRCGKMVSKMTIYNHVKHGCLKRGVEKQLNICELPVLQTWAAGEKV